mmetsp:Transcript_54394/g.158791  ORF Transcript_54394/g.158791 Transcript_54394/m.158791 type:complete len:231 (-) Transcript_54394:53-745(-)
MPATPSSCVAICLLRTVVTRTAGLALAHLAIQLALPSRCFGWTKSLPLGTRALRATMCAASLFCFLTALALQPLLPLPEPLLPLLRAARAALDGVAVEPVEDLDLVDHRRDPALSQDLIEDTHIHPLLLEHCPHVNELLPELRHGLLHDLLQVFHLLQALLQFLVFLLQVLLGLLGLGELALELRNALLLLGGRLLARLLLLALRRLGGALAFSLLLVCSGRSSSPRASL